MGLLGPVFPLYMVHLGFAEGLVGAYLAVFSIVSIAVRPYFGGQADTGRMRRSLGLAGFLKTIGHVGYLTGNPWVILVSRGIHGIGWAGINVVGSGWVAYLAPASRRAEAIGYFSMLQRIGIALGPVVGLWLLHQYGFTPAFVVAAALSFCVMLSTAIATTPDRISEAPPPPTGHWIRKLIEPEAVQSAGLIVLNTVPSIAMFNFMSLYFDSSGLPGIEGYFAALGVVGIVCRGFIGQLADRVGRRWGVVVGFAVQMVGLLVIAVSAEVVLITVGGMIWVVGSALSQPALNAVAIDRALPNRRGMAMATFTMAFRIGDGAGSLAAGIIAERLGYLVLNWFSAIAAILGLGIAWAVTRRWES